MTSSSHRIYDHQKLCGKQIRILCLDPPNGHVQNDQIQASLSILDLDSPRVSFQALSYVWGNASIPKATAIINELEFPITRALASALCHLRPRGDESPIYIWVDAVCIDQFDDTDKARQVCLMGEIYQKSSQATIWLPDPEVPLVTASTPFGTQASLRALPSYLAGDHFHDVPGYYVDKETGELAFEETAEFLAIWEGFKLLVNSPWWTRGWTVQEVIMPPRAQFFYGDAESCDFQTVEDAETRCWHHVGKPRPCCTDALAIFPKDKMEVLNAFNRQVWKIDFRRCARTRPRDGRDDFYIILRYFADRQCSNERDRVYSLWSQAVSSCFRDHDVDYKGPIADLFTDIFTRMIQEARATTNTKYWPGFDFRVLYGPGFGLSPKIPGKPSWVQDFSHVTSGDTLSAIIERMACSRLYRASGWKRSNLKVLNMELHLQGVRVDRIGAVQSAVTTLRDSKHLREVFGQWWDEVQTASNGRNMAEIHGDLARLVCADTFHDRLPLVKGAMKKAAFCIKEAFSTDLFRLGTELSFQRMADSELWRRALPGDYPHTTAWNRFFLHGDPRGLDRGYYEAVSVALKGRALFMTESSRQMGLCNPQAREGDEVWIVYGSRLPFVMRPVSRPGDGTATFHLVGDCYLQGVMDAEGIKPDGQTKDMTLV